jgi:AraC-like DNA-binding protein
MQLLAYYGYVEKLPSARRGDPARYLPTERFLNSWRTHSYAMLDALSLVAPAVAPVRDGLDEPRVFAAFCRYHTEIAAMELREELQEVAFVRIFLHRHAGWRLLWELADSRDDGGNALEPGRLSINETAQRLGVSRTHVTRLLNAGTRAGLVRYEGHGTVALEEAGLVSVRFLYATQCYVFAMAAQKAMVELGL